MWLFAFGWVVVVGILLVWGIRLKFQLAAARALADKLEAYKATHKEVDRVLLSVRDIFDHYGSYVHIDPKLAKLLSRLSTLQRRYVQALPSLLMQAPSIKQLRSHGSTPRPYDEGLGFTADFQEITELVDKINDPVLRTLWVIRSPVAMAEMIRHTVFLGFGYPNAVAVSSMDGVNVEVTQHCTPQDTNWGAASMNGLAARVDGVWADWRKHVHEKLPNRNKG